MNQIPQDNQEPLAVVIMAAGKGTRMKSSLPKVLHRLGGRALVAHVIATAAGIGARQIVVVTGHGAPEVEATLEGTMADLPLQFARQMPQLGTGHAVQQAAPLLPDDSTVLVLSGDVPLIDGDTLRALAADSAGRRLALLTIEVDEPRGTAASCACRAAARARARSSRSSRRRTPPRRSARSARSTAA